MPIARSWSRCFLPLALSLCPLLRAAEAPGTPAQAAGPVAAPKPVAGPGFRITTGKPYNLFADGEPVTFKITAVEAGRSLALTVFDADGQALGSITVASTAGSIETGISPQGKRYLAVVIADPREPAKPLAQLSLAVLPPAPPPDRRFGLSVRPDFSGLVRRLGGYWLRSPLSREQEQPGKLSAGNGIEQTVATIRAGGCEVVGSANHPLPEASVPAADANGAGHDVLAAADLAAWDAYLADTARRIRGTVPVFEIWNEAGSAQFPRSTPATFAQRVADCAVLLKRGSATLRKEAPGLLIGAGVMADTPGSTASEFLRALLQKGCADAIDFVSVHYGRATTGPERLPADQAGSDSDLDGCLRRLADVQREFRIAKAVWLTEIGSPTAEPGGADAAGESEQAASLVRSHVIGLANGVAVVLWSELDGTGCAVYREERGPKPAMPAYIQLTRALEGRSFSRRVPDSTVRVYEFRAGKKDSVLVAWALEPPPPGALKTWSLPAGYELVRAENLFGEKLELTADAPLPLSSSPVYLFCRQRPP